MVLGYRVCTFALALGYFIEMLTRQGLTVLHYLTIWGLVCSILSAGLMIFQMYSPKNVKYHFFPGATFCVNIVVMVLYWQLYFQDPHLLYGDSPPLPWYRDDYLHFVGPMLQCIDAAFIYKAFEAQKLQSLFTYYGISGSYVIMSETVFHLPYPFMLSLSFYERVLFYQKGLLVGTLGFILGNLLSWVAAKPQRLFSLSRNTP
jgi:hypothetical protein